MLFRSTNKPYSFYTKNVAKKRNFIPIKIGLIADRQVIYDRINQRVYIMIQNGLLDEVTQLKKYENLNALQTVGYRELFQYLNQEINLDFAIEEIKKNTRRYAKRQLTWFRKDTEITWFDWQTNPTKIIKHIEQQILNHEKYIQSNF